MSDVVNITIQVLDQVSATISTIGTQGPDGVVDQAAIEAIAFDSLTFDDQGSHAPTIVRVEDGDLFVGSAEIAQVADLSIYVLTSAMQAAPTKATPIDADGVSIIDSAASNAFKRVLWSQIKATLKTYFDTLYSAASWGSITGTLSSQTDLQTALNAKVTSGGALGTPSSGTITNLTGTASININGTVGATTPTTVAATSFTASGTMKVGSATEYVQIEHLGVSGSYIGSMQTGGTKRSCLLHGSNFYFNVGTSGYGTTAAVLDTVGNATFYNKVAIGNGTLISKVLSATATLDFGSVAANSFADLTITVTGAAVGDTVSIGVPNGSLLNDISFFGWVSATNTVTVRCSNVSSTTARDPASGTFRATVTQF